MEKDFEKNRLSTLEVGAENLDVSTHSQTPENNINSSKNQNSQSTQDELNINILNNVARLAQAQAQSNALRVAQASSQYQNFKKNPPNLPTAQELRASADQIIESSLQLRKLMEEIFTRYKVDEAQAYAAKFLLFNLHQKIESITETLIKR